MSLGAAVFQSVRLVVEGTDKGDAKLEKFSDAEEHVAKEGKKAAKAVDKLSDEMVEVSKTSKKARDNLGRFVSTGDKMKTSARDAGKALKGLGLGMAGVGGASNNATENLALLTGAMKVGVVGVAAYATKELAEATWRFVEAGARVQTLTRSFEKLGGTEKDLATLRGAVLGTVDDITLRRMFNLSQQLKLTKDQFTQLLPIAKAAANATGIQMGEAVERLTLGLGKLEPELLDELGLAIRLDTEYKRFGATLGKNSQQLTEVEKRQAAFNAVLRESGKLMSAVGVRGAGDEYAQFSAELTNLLNDLKSAAADAGRGLAAFGADAIRTIRGVNEAAALARGQVVDSAMSRIGFKRLAKLIDEQRALQKRLEAVTSAEQQGLFGRNDGMAQSQRHLMGVSDVENGRAEIARLEGALVKVQREADVAREHFARMSGQAITGFLESKGAAVELETAVGAVRLMTGLVGDRALEAQDALGAAFVGPRLEGLDAYRFAMESLGEAVDKVEQKFQPLITTLTNAALVGFTDKPGFRILVDQAKARLQVSERQRRAMEQARREMGLGKKRKPKARGTLRRDALEFLRDDLSRTTGMDFTAAPGDVRELGAFDQGNARLETLRREVESRELGLKLVKDLARAEREAAADLNNFQRDMAIGENAGQGMGPLGALFVEGPDQIKGFQLALSETIDPMRKFGEMGASAFSGLADAMGKATAAAIIHGDNFAKAVKSAGAAQLETLSTMAFGQAAYLGVIAGVGAFLPGVFGPITPAAAGKGALAMGGVGLFTAGLSRALGGGAGSGAGGGGRGGGGLDGLGRPPTPPRDFSRDSEPAPIIVRLGIGRGPLLNAVIDESDSRRGSRSQRRLMVEGEF